MSQFIDDFSDGDFIQNPEWQGDVAAFEVNSQDFLHLVSTGTDTSILYTNSSIISNTEWRFVAKHSFNSSSNNNSRVYIAASNNNLAGDVDGYYVQIGSTQDNISLWRQDGDIHTEIITGTNVSTGNSVNLLQIKVICDPNGNWELFAYDLQNGNGYISEGTANDITYTMCSKFGIFCKYTSSNATKFYFDDFYIGSIVLDTIAPLLSAVEVISANELLLQFDEVVEKNSAENESNYNIDGGIGVSGSAIRDVIDSSKVKLYFPNALTYAQIYNLTISNISDNAGNISNDISEVVVYYNITKGDIVINEIMCDPSPTIGLPDAEYIELYNNSPKDLQLSGWSIIIGSSEKVFTTGKIAPGDYAIIGHEDDESLFLPYGNFIGLSSFSLPNTSGTILLKNDSNNIIHYINYKQAWYNNSAKQDGGWSLEQIDASNYCGGSNNWSASSNINGGTPGTENSIKANNPDVEGPMVDRVVVINTMSLQIFFDESTDSITAKKLLNYEVDNGIGNPISITSSYPDYKSYILNFSTAIQASIIYNINVKSGIEDCAGNFNIESKHSFGLPQISDSNDVQINEVLFHPSGDGVDYVEIFNKSDKIIDLKYLRLSNWDYEDEEWSNVKEISPDGYLIFPNTYYVITTSALTVKNQYFVKEVSNIIEVEYMPSMSNTSGNIYLISNALQMIDGMEYSDEMHYSLLNNPEGISLERLSSTTSAMESTNWHSAATPGLNADGFGGTPTYINSQNAGIAGEGEWNVTPEIFSPDNDGRDDFLQINYKMKDAGYTANINIYDSKGRLVRKLSAGEVLGANGFIVWDGLNEDNQKANIGIYVLLIEYFNPNGDAQQLKLSCVLGGVL